MSDFEIGPVGPIECPVCSSETTFWMQENGRAMCPCTARRTVDAADIPAEVRDASAS